MPHAFDTGLAAPQRTLILNGAATLLAGLLRPTGYLNAVITWGGVIRSYTDDVGLDNLWAALQGRNPAVAIVLGDRTNKAAGLGGFKSKSDIDLTVFVLSRHPRGMDVGRQQIDVVGAADVTADPGLHVILEHVEELIVGRRCGASPTIKQLELTRELEVRTEGGFTLWAQHYSVTVDRQIKENRTITQMLADLRTTVHLSETTVPAPNDPTIKIDNPTT